MGNKKMDFFILNQNNSESKKLIHVILFFIAVIFLVPAFQQNTYAINASSEVFSVRQPDGSSIRLRIRGDEYFNWYEDLEGYTVVIDEGQYKYASLDIVGDLAATNLVVGINNPALAGLGKRILPSAEKILSQMPEQMQVQEDIAAAAVPPSGTVKNLVVLCMFSDHDPNLHTRPREDYDILFNQIGGDVNVAPTGSVKDLYLENSYGIMTLDSNVVTWVTLPHTEAYYANGDDGTGFSYPNNAQGMVYDALELVDPLVDFSQFDNDSDGYIDSIDIIHSGYGAETGGGGGNWIWSHRWSLYMVPGNVWTSDDGVKVYDYHTEPALWGTSGTNIVRFGVIAHETGHFFGLPDLYDTDYSGEGIGSWGMMANSWGFDYSQLHPPHFSVWSKIRLGWVTPTVINPGIHILNQVETNAEVYRIDYGYPTNEYLLIENRQPVGIETTIPQGGLCIYHIDDNAGYNTEGYPGQPGWPENGNHYRVTVLQADGNYNLEKNQNRGDSGDVYHGNGVATINHTTVPNTDAYQNGTIIVNYNAITDISVSGSTMSFNYSNEPVPEPPVANDIYVQTIVDSNVVAALDGSDEGLPDPPGMLTYIIVSLPNDGNLVDVNTGSLVSSVPYSLADFGNEVTYEPNTGFAGDDEFDFKVNDGGSEPNGGDSPTATVYLTVAGPAEDFVEDFEEGLGIFNIDKAGGRSMVCNFELSVYSNRSFRTQLALLWNRWTMRLRYWSYRK
jgi:M6 family metalloprotease-like protein